MKWSGRVGEGAGGMRASSLEGREENRNAVNRAPRPKESMAKYLPSIPLG